MVRAACAGCLREWPRVEAWASLGAYTLVTTYATHLPCMRGRRRDDGERAFDHFASASAAKLAGLRVLAAIPGELIARLVQCADALNAAGVFDDVEALGWLLFPEVVDWSDANHAAVGAFLEAKLHELAPRPFAGRTLGVESSTAHVEAAAPTRRR